MPYNPQLLTALDRVRFALGDIATTELFPDATYTALLAAYNNNEVLAIQAGARALAAYYATQPTQVASNGSSLTWGERIKQWNTIALGANTPSTSARGFAFAHPARRVDGYTP